MIILLAVLLHADDGSWRKASTNRPKPCADFFTSEEIDAQSRAPLVKIYAEASKKVAAIHAAFAALPASDQAYFRLTVRAVEAALGKHHHEYMEEGANLRQLHFQNHYANLKQIADFDPARARWSLFQIERQFKRKDSLQQYVDCLED